MPAGFQDAEDFERDLLAFGGGVYFMQKIIGNHGIEGMIREGQLPGVAVGQSHFSGYLFYFCVLDHGCGTVAADGAGHPPIEPDSRSGMEMTRRSDEQQAAPAAHVENTLIAAPRDGIENPIAVAQLPAFAVGEHAAGRGEEVRAGNPGEPVDAGVEHAWKDLRRGNAEGGGDQQAGDDAGGIDAVVRSAGHDGESIAFQPAC